MSHHLINLSSVVQAQLRKDIPPFKVGSKVSVHYKIREGAKERIQIFTGLVIDKHAGNSIDATFTVLKVATGSIKTVRVFPIHSPNIVKVVVDVLQRARKANLRYLKVVKDPIKKLRSKKVKSFAPVTKVESIKEETVIDTEVVS
jgi:large subunit ribosomal protein L19